MSDYRAFQKFVVEQKELATEVGAIAASNYIFEIQAERDRARLALKDLFLMMDESILVRNTDNDGDPDWARKMLDVVTRLKWAHDSIGCVSPKETKKDG